jgi:hypothetical protein
MKAKWMDIEAKVWFIEQKGSIKMYSIVISIFFLHGRSLGLARAVFLKRN